MMQYKGYSGVAEIAFDTGMIYGRVVGLRDIVTFQGETVAEAAQAFRDSVDDYLELCASRNEPPEKPFSGKFLIRIPSDLHRTLVEAASRRGVSLNGLIESTLIDAFPAPDAPRPARRPKPENPGLKAPASRRKSAAKTPGPEAVSTSS